MYLRHLKAKVDFTFGKLNNYFHSDASYVVLYCYSLLWPNRIRETFTERHSPNTYNMLWRYGPNWLISCVFSHPKWMNIICHATGARLETIIGVRHPSQVSSSWSLLFRFVDTDTHILSFGLRLSMKMKVASESKSDLHIRTIGIGQESAHKHIQLRRNTFLQTYFFSQITFVETGSSHQSSSSPSISSSSPPAAVCLNLPVMMRSTNSQIALNRHGDDQEDAENYDAL